MPPNFLTPILVTAVSAIAAQAGSQPSEESAPPETPPSAIALEAPASTDSTPPAYDASTLVAPQPAAAAPKPETKPSDQPAQPAEMPPAKPWRRFEVASQDGKHRLEIRGLVHADARFFLAGEHDNAFAVRRVRPSLEGTVFRYYEFKLQPDFAGSRLVILDAYANAHFIDEIQVRVGKGKAPVGLERLQSPAGITFAERALPTLLVPNRDIGAQLHGTLLEGAVEWAAGVYNGVPNGQSGDVDANDSKDFVGRLFLRPLAPFGIEAIGDLGVGVAAMYGEQAGQLAGYRSSGQEDFFTYSSGTEAAGRRTLLSPQAHYYYGPFGLLFEYVQVAERVTSSGGAEVLTNEAWQIAGSVVIGGEPSYQGVGVDQPLDPSAGTWGAVELAGRFSGLALDRTAFALGAADAASSARTARAVAVGLTWHWAPRVRTLANFERTSFDGGAPGGDRRHEVLLVSRMQIAF